MQSFRVVQELEGTPEDFWAMLLDPEYVREFNATAGISPEIVRFVRHGARVERDIRYRSQKPVPLLLKPFMPDGIGYMEYASFDAQAGRYQHRLTPIPLGNRLDLEATITLEPVSAERFLRVYQGSVRVHVPVVGARLEREALRVLGEPQPEGAKVTHAWLQRLALARGDALAENRRN
jgi:hypothetical protein